jgi:hypothetical protein
MKNINKQLFRTTIAILMLFLSLNAKVFAQTVSYKIVGNEVQDASVLKIGPTVSFAIPPSDLVKGLPSTFNLEAQYWTKLIDFRATGSFGTFKGTSIGATYHMVNRVMNKKDKFVISRTKSGNKETTTFFKAPVKIYRISGPCADLTTGVFGEAGFFTKLDFGWDFQTNARAYAVYDGRSIKGSRNGWMSLKVQGVLANVAIDMTDYFKLGAGTGKYTEERKMAVGGQVNFGVAARPWKGVTLYMSLPVGYMKYMGVSDAPETTSKGAPILNINIGAQVRL